MGKQTAEKVLPGPRDMIADRYAGGRKLISSRVL